MNDDSNDLDVMDRRRFLATSVIALAAAGDRAYGPDAPPVRYPDPDLVKVDDGFNGFDWTAGIVRLYHSKRMVWAEGPAWNGVGRYLVWSDIPNNVQLRWIEDDGHVSVLRHGSNHSNGNTFDFQGRQISFEHGTRSVVRYEYDGTRTVLAGTYGGKSLNAPNDGAVHPSGDIFFSDAGYGQHLSAPPGSPQPYQKEAIYRIDAASGELVQLTDEIYKPNGLCFSPDYKRVYAADTGASHYPEAPKVIRVWDVVEGRRGLELARGRDFASMELALADGRTVAGFADGIRADVDGNIWASAGWVGDGYDGVHIFEPREGRRVAMIRLPEVCSNVCFGGIHRNRLFMTASQSLYAVYVNTKGAHIA